MNKVLIRQMGKRGTRLTVNGKVATTAQARQAEAGNYQEDKAEGADLRYGDTFRFIPVERPRVTQRANRDARYTPNGYTMQGTTDLRYNTHDEARRQYIVDQAFRPDSEV